ncbi:SET domain-containing protein-lysine N-methyltransferase [Sansalvadorimonas verongulae]|uniref:SET domain-containing protein-lysine N-methyltransferase n=1 Tax=Sansalvadorimonas verongulae TaxID=2172824 RepID=UPI0012BD68BA|nr:SET domain-containing protein-lysine N-methyltransferase [Sansalvadorimonas verongulae]MTI13161.1 SET domain-containing protein [Sansalvadorimonas verongulae]
MSDTDIDRQTVDQGQASKEKPFQEKVASLQSEIAELRARLANYEFRLEEATSTIPGAGTGLFTRDFIPSGRVVGEYTGRKSFRLLVPSTGRYVMWQRDEQGMPHFLNKDTYILWLVDEEEDDEPWRGEYPGLEMGIDGTHSDNCMRYANSNDDPNLEMFVTEDQHVVAVSLRDIEPNQELFWDYHPGRDKDFEIVPDHIETDLEKFIIVDDKGCVRLTEQALQIPQERGGKKRKKRRKK